MTFESEVNFHFLMLVKLVCSRLKESIACKEIKRLNWGLDDIEKGIHIPFDETIVIDLGKGIFSCCTFVFFPTL